MSNERCSTATSGFYSLAESDSSNRTEHSSTNTKLDNSEPAKGLSKGLQEGERKLHKHAKKHFHKSTDSSRSYVSKIPPPKQLRYNFQKSSRDLPYLQSNSDGDHSANNTKHNQRILKNKNKI